MHVFTTKSTYTTSTVFDRCCEDLTISSANVLPSAYQVNDEARARVSIGSIQRTTISVSYISLLNPSSPLLLPNLLRSQRKTHHQNSILSTPVRHLAMHAVLHPHPQTLPYNLFFRQKPTRSVSQYIGNLPTHSHDIRTTSHDEKRTLQPRLVSQTQNQPQTFLMTSANPTLGTFRVWFAKGLFLRISKNGR